MHRTPGPVADEPPDANGSRGHAAARTWRRHRGAVAVCAALVACSQGALPSMRAPTAVDRSAPAAVHKAAPVVSAKPRATGHPQALEGMPPIPDRRNIYADAGANELSPIAAAARPLIYVPNSESDTLDEIDPATGDIVRHISVGGEPQHVVPSWDLRTLYVTSDAGNSLTAIDPNTGRVERTLSVRDPYNMYFTPDGRYAIVVAERLRRLDFRDPHSFRLIRSLSVPRCAGVDHIDFSADGRYLIASCEFAGRLIKVDVRRQRLVQTIDLGPGAMPQDVKVSPDGSVFYVADVAEGGVHLIDGDTMLELGFVATGAGAHGLYPSRDARFLYVSNRSAGSISVISFRRQRVVRTWSLPGGGSPDMGGVSADGTVLWLAGRYDGVVYAIDVRRWRLVAKITVGSGPHGLCVWPQPGRYSLGHTGVMR
jgi:DNA-binding beta-propeller fold protein YncE